MSDRISDPIAETIAECFVAELAELASSARVALPRTAFTNALELQDNEDTFLAFIPGDTAPRMAVIANRLYGQGLNHGLQVGKEAAMRKFATLPKQRHREMANKASHWIRWTP